MLKSSDCNFMFCLPLTKESFEADAHNTNKHFVREHLPVNVKKKNEPRTLWEVYQDEVVKPYLLVKKQFSPYGFSFHENVTFDQFATLIHKFHVNIVFSHCRIGDSDIEAVEFYDKLVGVTPFLEVIPTSYNKLIDLSVCKPDHLANTLKLQRPQMVTKSSSKPIEMTFWLYIYSMVFKIIHTQEIDFYSTAFEKAIFKINEK